MEAVETDNAPHVDLWLAAISAALVVAGLIMVLSSSQAISYLTYDSSLYVFFHQAFFAAVGLVALLVLARTDYHRLRKWAAPGAALSLLLMVIVLVPHVGVNSYGAERWIGLGSIGTIQPSEIVKLGTSIYLAHWIAKRGNRIKTFSGGFLPMLIMLGVLLGLLMLQKDLGTALVVTSIFGAAYLTGGAPKRYLVVLVVLLIVSFVGFVLLESYRVDRLTTYLNPFADPQNKTLQAYQALLGLGSGGITGVGLGHSVQKYDWLPQADTDFIFAIVGEETGLIGATLLLGGFVFFAVRGYRTAMRAPDRMGVILASAITTWITFQALVNMGVVTDTLPITGVPLPFISYGGSALVMCMAAVGVLLNISSQGVQRASTYHRRSDAAADSGRGHRRSPVAGTRRGAGVSH
jgi:cell division protein FtsW